jgi:DNA topoisomerase-1
LRFLFKGKSGKTWRLSINNRRVAKIVRMCQELPGQHLFQYQTPDGSLQKISSTDVNDYLRELTGRDVTAKDFRTWAGTVEAALALHALNASGEPVLKKHLRAVFEQVASRLGNTVAICRKCYVHPEIVAAYEAEDLQLELSGGVGDTLDFDDGERAVLSFLKSRLKTKAT